MVNSGHPAQTTLTIGLVAGILCTSTGAILIRFAQSEQVPSITIAAARLAFASIIIAPLTLIKYRSKIQAMTRKEWLLALLSGLFLALHFASWITSLEYTSVANSVVLVSTAPLWVVLLSSLLFREKVSRYMLLGLALALIGGTIISISDACTWQSGRFVCGGPEMGLAGSEISGDLLALTGAWMAAGYLLIGRRLRKSLPLIPYIQIVYGTGALVLIGIMLLTGNTLLGFTPLSYLYFLLLAIIPQLLGHTLFNWALRFIPASFVAVVLLGEPIGSTLFAFLLFNERPGALMLSGAVFLLAGIWFSSKNLT